MYCSKIQTAHDKKVMHPRMLAILESLLVMMMMMKRMRTTTMTLTMVMMITKVFENCSM